MKKNIKNVSGFTLIELLAVIVVLAIVILMASMAVIPRMTEARKQVFAMEANEAINAASAYWLDASINGQDSFPVGNKVECVSVATLREKGDFKNDANYDGVVYVRQKSDSTNNYEYVITMTNHKLMVTNQGASGDVKPNTVTDYNATNFPTECVKNASGGYSWPIS